MSFSLLTLLNATIVNCERREKKSFISLHYTSCCVTICTDGRPGSRSDGGSSSSGNNGLVTPGGSSSSSGGGSGGGAACQITCLNGGTCINNKCICRAGYQGDYCGERNFNNSLLLLEMHT